jgi:threonine synthase
LGEGGTPLLRSEQLGKLTALPRFYLKNETSNPTWSYKDRANTVAISVGKALGFRKIVAVTTGNHGCSVAAYAAAAGLRSVILCHEDISPALVDLIHLYGGRAVVGGPREAFLKALVQRGDWFPAATLAPHPQICSPYGVEGFKTIAYEIFEQLGNLVPDRVFVPVGSGDGCFGIWKGFRELHTLGLAKSLPRIYACQAEGSNPIVRSFRQGLSEVLTVPNARTSALSIRESTSSPLTLRAVYESGGEALDCSESEIEEMRITVGRLGLSIEGASATAVACSRKMAESGRIGTDETIVCVLTGAGIKWPETLAQLPRREPISGRELPEFEALIGALDTE